MTYILIFDLSYIFPMIEPLALYNGPAESPDTMTERAMDAQELRRFGQSKPEIVVNLTCSLWEVRAALVKN